MGRCGNIAHPGMAPRAFGRSPLCYWAFRRGTPGPGESSRQLLVAKRMVFPMLHLMYYQDARPVYLCGWQGELPHHHTQIHIARASDSLFTQHDVCAMCHLEWHGAVDSLEWRVRE